MRKDTGVGTNGTGAMARELVEDYVVDVEGLLTQIDAALSRLSANQSDKSIIDSIFRDIHSIKGNSRFLGLDKISDVCHLIEEVLQLIRSNNLAIESNVIETLFMSLDTLKSMLNDVRLNTDTSPSVYETLTAELKKVKELSCGVINKEGARQKLKILIVDDDSVSVGIIERYMASFGDISVAVNGQEGLDKFYEAHKNHSSYDVIYLDIIIPLIDGHDVLKAMRSYEKANKIKNEAKVFMVTVVDDPKEAVKAYLRGRCNGYIVKPVDKKKLFESLSTFFNVKCNG
ncbi:Signal transduction response regulator, receiver region [Candidatus Magnetoovum chiemensis]|nr:Signal transduction response regulator, receiver region [Candidatus Magnetoovum chiemensis]